MDKKNAAEFINSYNKIDAQLRQLYDFKPSQSFSDMVRRSAEKNGVIRKYENDLMDFARLRNAIVHQSTDGKIIAVPCDEVVEEIQLIERLLCTPPTIGATLREKRIVSVDDSISLKQVIRLIANTNYSNLPVYDGRRMIGVLNNRRLVRGMGSALEEGNPIGDYLSQPCVSAIHEGDMMRFYKVLGKKNTVQEAIDAFDENRKLLAVIVTASGNPNDEIVNLLTSADLPKLLRLLEE